MTKLHAVGIVAGALCFALEALGIGSPTIKLPYLGMAFFVLAFL